MKTIGTNSTIKPKGGEIRMRYVRTFRLFTLALLVMGSGAFLSSKVLATHTVTDAEDVRNTKHNLASNPDILATGTTEVCVFCHTPHGGTRVEPDNAAPLWNRRLPVAGSFTLYGGPNFDASNLGTTIKGVSLACLSCHDGTIALDALVNVGGSGGLIAANLTAGAGGTSAASISFTGPGVGADSMKEGLRDAIEEGPTAESPFSGGIHDTVFQVGSTEAGMEPFPNLTPVLTDDHPISMEVPAANFNVTGGKTDPQFALIGTNSTLDGGLDGVNVKFITRGANKPTDKRDRLRAYPSTATGGSYYIECASCHNPHTPRVSFLRLPSFVPGLVTGVDVTPGTLIGGTGPDATKTWGQRPNSGSAICLSCHEK